MELKLNQDGSHRARAVTFGGQRSKARSLPVGICICISPVYKCLLHINKIGTVARVGGGGQVVDLNATVTSLVHESAKESFMNIMKLMIMSQFILQSISEGERIWNKPLDCREDCHFVFGEYYKHL